LSLSLSLFFLNCIHAKAVEHSRSSAKRKKQVKRHRKSTMHPKNAIPPPADTEKGLEMSIQGQAFVRIFDTEEAELTSDENSEDLTESEEEYSDDYELYDSDREEQDKASIADLETALQSPIENYSRYQPPVLPTVTLEQGDNV